MRYLCVDPGVDDQLRSWDTVGEFESWYELTFGEPIVLTMRFGSHGCEHYSDRGGLVLVENEGYYD